MIRKYFPSPTNHSTNQPSLLNPSTVTSKPKSDFKSGVGMHHHTQRNSCIILFIYKKRFKLKKTEGTVLRKKWGVSERDKGEERQGKFPNAAIVIACMIGCHNNPLADLRETHRPQRRTTSVSNETRPRTQSAEKR